MNSGLKLFKREVIDTNIISSSLATFQFKQQTAQMVVFYVNLEFFQIVHLLEIPMK